MAPSKKIHHSFRHIVKTGVAPIQKSVFDLLVCNLHFYDVLFF